MKQDNPKIPVIVLTRFNLALKYNYRKLYKNRDVNDSNLWIDEDYLKKKFEVFEKITLQSLLSQSDMEYKWLIFFHKDTPEKFRLLINEYKAKLNNIEDMYFDDDESEKYNEIVSGYLKREFREQDIITIRLDNDDAIHKDFIFNVRNELRDTQGEKVVSFVNGLQYCMTNKRLVKFPFKTNHFLALKCNSRNDINSILQTEHMMINERYKEVIYIKTKVPQWIEVVNDINAYNQMRYTLGSVFVKYNLKSEYPYVEVDWKNRKTYSLYIIHTLKKILARNIKSLFRRIKKKSRLL